MFDFIFFLNNLVIPIPYLPFPPSADVYSFSFGVLKPIASNLSSIFSSTRWVLIVLFNFPHICGNQSLSFFFFLLGDLYPTASIAPPLLIAAIAILLYSLFFLYPMSFFSLLLFFLQWVSNRDLFLSDGFQK